MSKKELTVEERLKKYGREIMGVAIIYLILEVLIIFMSGKELLGNTVAMVEYASLIVLFVLMIVGVAKRKSWGVICGWIFEAILVLGAVLGFFTPYGGVDLIGLIVIIALPFDLVGFSKALKEMGE